MVHVPIVSQHDIHASIVRAGLNTKQANEIGAIVEAYTTRVEPDSPQGYMSARQVVDLVHNLDTHQFSHITSEDKDRIKKELETHLK